MSRENSVNLFPSKNFIQILYVYIRRNKKPCQAQLILNYALLEPMCINHPKILTSQKLSSLLSLLGIKSFHELFILGGRREPISCLVFYLFIKKWENLYMKSHQKWQTAVKTFKKKIKIFQRKHTKRGKYCFIEVNIHCF